MLIGMANSNKPPKKNRNKAWRIFLWLLFFTFLVFGIPKMETLLHPNTVLKVEKMLNRSNFGECTVTVERKDMASILITVKPDEKFSITTEFYKYFMNDLSKTQDETVLFNHTINQHPNGTFYLTQTQIWADTDLKKARRIAVEYCDQISNPEGRVAYDGHLPIYQCAVPVDRATCFAVNIVANQSK